MSNEFFTELSVEQQETVAGGQFSFNFAATDFLQSAQGSLVGSASDATGSTTSSLSERILIGTSGTTLNGIDIPEGFLESFFGA